MSRDTIQFRASKELRDAIQAIADRDDRTMTAVITRALQQTYPELSPRPKFVTDDRKPVEERMKELEPEIQATFGVETCPGHSKQPWDCERAGCKYADS